jgi:tetratricopeptide (TPR) repeat protein
MNYAHYIGIMFWPKNLAAVYPDTAGKLPVMTIAMSAAVLLGVSVLAVRSAKRRPYVAFGWLWYLITLLPVSGIVEQGRLNTADHFTYVPLIGLFVIVVWGVPDLLSAVDSRRVTFSWLLPGLSATVILASMAVSYVQVGYWRDSITLFTRAVQVTDNYYANFCLGAALGEAGDDSAAVQRLRRALDLDPRLADAHFYLGNILAAQGKITEAIPELAAAVRLDPRVSQKRVNLGVALARAERLDEAIEQFNAALKIRPEDEVALRNLQRAEGQKAMKP